MFRLHVVPAHGDPFDRLLEGESLIIGRSSDSDLMIADRFLSRQHARLVKEGDEWLAEDLGSRNGTLLNGQPIERPTPVNVGDDLQLCGSVISIKAVSMVPQSSADHSGSDLGQHTVFRQARDLIDSQSDSAKEIDAPDQLRRIAERLQMLNDIHQTLSGNHRRAGAARPDPGSRLRPAAPRRGRDLPAQGRRRLLPGRLPRRCPARRVATRSRQP